MGTVTPSWVFMFVTVAFTFDHPPEELRLVPFSCSTKFVAQLGHVTEATWPVFRIVSDGSGLMVSVPTK